jgi:hypothetical protein
MDGTESHMLEPNEIASKPRGWRLSPNATGWRIFFTCWVVYGLHFTTDVVRETYPAVALGDHFSFRLDEYGGLHPDLFEMPGHGWHIGNNPGISMFAAIPYALFRPIIDPLVAHVQAGRLARGDTVPPAFDSPRTRSPGFFAETYRRGLDIKLGLAAFVTQVFFMAPGSALGVVLVFIALRWALRDDRKAVWLALLYAFGTPVFFRTGFLNHNLMLGHIAFAGFLAVWNPAAGPRIDDRWRAYWAGVAGGTAILFDYSGVVFLLGLFAYVLVKRFHERDARYAVTHGAWYVLGTLPPVFLLWFYQWRAFGNPFLPGQNWMPPVEWIELGYRGYGLPQLELLLALAFDHRFGFFVTAPITVLGFAAFLLRKRRPALPMLEMVTCVALFLALWVFFAGSNYVRLQWNTGVRYMAPVLPFLFLPAALVLARMRRFPLLVLATGSVVLNWCMAMNREVWRPLGVLEPVVRVLTGGFELPALTTLSRMQMFRDLVPDGVSPLPLFALTAVILWLVWRETG